MKTIMMYTFYDDIGNFSKIPLETILERMTDDWIDDNITDANVSELRDACKTLLSVVKELEEEIKNILGILVDCRLLLIDDDALTRDQRSKIIQWGVNKKDVDKAMINILKKYNYLNNNQ